MGISPSLYISPNLSKGSHIEKSFVLSRSDPIEDLYFKVTMEGATKDWTTLDKGTEFVMPKGQQRFPITVTADIPKNTADGEYRGGIRLESSLKSPGKTGGNGSSVSLSALIQTDFTVSGNQILEYEVASIGIQNIEEGSPLNIFLTLNNTGNVTARPTKVHVDVFDKVNANLLESQDVTDMGVVEPLTTGNITILVPTKQGLGQYWARIYVYKNEVLMKEQNLVFEIVPVGSLHNTGDLKELLCNKTAALGEIVKITGVFENTGQSGFSAKLTAEIYKDEKLIKISEGEPTNVGTGKTENLITYFTPTSAGDYLIKAYVSFSGGKTGGKEFKFYVGNPGVLGLATVRGGILPVLSVIMIAGIITITVYLWKKRAKKV